MPTLARRKKVPSSRLTRRRRPGYLSNDRYRPSATSGIGARERGCNRRQRSLGPCKFAARVGRPSQLCEASLLVPISKPCQTKPHSEGAPMTSAKRDAGVHGEATSDKAGDKLDGRLLRIAGVFVLGSFMSILDSTIVNVAIK